MPGSAKKDGKKKKKSKKELEAERLALEEQKRKEEEAARLAELARQREAELAEQKDREERDAALEAEEGTFESERQASVELRQQMVGHVDGILAARDKEEEWDAYISCSRLPNPRVEAEVVAYLAEFIQLPEKPSFGYLESDLAEAERLHALLETRYSRSIDYRDGKADRYAFNIREARAAIERKWDALSAHILQNSELFPRESTENLLIFQDFPPSVRFCLWANYTKNPRHKAFDVADMHVTLPKSLTLANVAIRVIHDRSDSTLMDLSLQQNTTSRDDRLVSRHIILDGVIFFSLLELPELPKTADFWTIRALLANDLSVRHVPYPFPRGTEEGEGGDGSGDSGGGEGSLDASSPNATAAAAAASGATGSNGAVGGDGSTAPPGSAPTPVKDDDSAMIISYSVGSELFLHPLATVKWWCAKSCTWRTEGISDVEIDRAKGTVQFKTSVFKPCALVQEAFSDFPSEEWRLRPVLPGPLDPPPLFPSVRLSMNGKWSDLEVEISAKGVTLIRPMNDRLEVFKGKWFPPTLFFMKLCRFGLAFASPCSFLDQNTSPIKEDNECYWAMATRCTQLAFSAHKANLTSVNARVFCAMVYTGEPEVVAPPLLPEVVLQESAASAEGGGAATEPAAPATPAAPAPETKPGTAAPPSSDPAAADAPPGSAAAGSPPGTAPDSSGEKQAQPGCVIVANYNHVISTKARKAYFISNEADLIKWSAECKPHGTLLSVLADVASGEAADMHLTSTVAQVLAITSPLNTTPVDMS
ncbi:Protein casc1 [Blastocladiella emersonii ATCC 22665]|nr:Protein casc1 [Blastocladiella emersonii ATCC 22665]